MQNVSCEDKTGERRDLIQRPLHVAKGLTSRLLRVERSDGSRLQNQTFLNKAICGRNSRQYRGRTWSRRRTRVQNVRIKQKTRFLLNQNEAYKLTSHICAHGTSSKFLLSCDPGNGNTKLGSFVRRRMFSSTVSKGRRQWSHAEYLQLLFQRN